MAVPIPVILACRHSQAYTLHVIVILPGTKSRRKRVRYRKDMCSLPGRMFDLGVARCGIGRSLLTDHFAVD